MTAYCSDAFDVVGEITLSRRLGFLEAGYDIDHLLEGVVDELDRRGRAQQMPWVDKLGRRNPLYARFYKPSSKFVLHARGIIQDRLADEKHEAKSLKNKGDFMEQFLEAQKRHPQIVNGPTLGSYVMTNFLAGSDTTAITLRSIIYHTLRTPGVLERLRKEIDEYVGSEFPVSWKTSQTMPYLDAIIKEGLRIHPIGAIMFERKIPESGLTMSNGLKLPAGTVVAMTPWTLNWDESLFGAEPRKFKPDRWLPQPGETEEQAMERINTMKRNDFSFSYGPRVCLGKHIALMEIYKLVPTLFGLLDVSTPYIILSFVFLCVVNKFQDQASTSGKGMESLGSVLRAATRNGCDIRMEGWCGQTEVSKLSSALYSTHDEPSHGNAVSGITR